MRLSVRVDVNMNTKAVKAAGAGFARDFADQLGDLTAKYAKENVAPGSGPGPHPHRPDGWQHVDTGELMRSIQTEPENRGFLVSTRVFTNLDYGLYLEAGFHSKSGKLWRYPWLMPAGLQAQQSVSSIVQSSVRRWFSESGRMYKGRVNFEAPLSGTAWPE